jgi:hypothetical protein
MCTRQARNPCLGLDWPVTRVTPGVAVPGKGCCEWEDRARFPSLRLLSLHPFSCWVFPAPGGEEEVPSHSVGTYCSFLNNITGYHLSRTKVGSHTPA